MNSLYVVLVDWEHVGVSMYFDYPNQFKDFTKLHLEVEDKSDVYSENSNLMEMIKNLNMKVAEFYEENFDATSAEKDEWSLKLK